jgi:hypothetical protein
VRKAENTGILSQKRGKEKAGNPKVENPAYFCG